MLIYQYMSISFLEREYSMIKEVYNVIPQDIDNFSITQYKERIKAFNGFNVLYNDLTISTISRSYIIEKGSLVKLIENSNKMYIKLCNSKTLTEYELFDMSKDYSINNEEYSKVLKEHLIYLYDNFRRGEVVDYLGNKLNFIYNWGTMLSIIGFVISIVLLVLILYGLGNLFGFSESVISSISVISGFIYFIAGLLFGLNNPDRFLALKWKKYDKQITEYAKNHDDEMFVADYASNVPLLPDNNKDN